MDLPLALFQPAVGVVTNIGTDHYSEFGSLDAIADEKAKLLRSLPADGIAVLNSDDARVLGMRVHFSGRILTYGTARDATLRGDEISAAWPDRLSLSVYWNGESVRVQTQLCGAHWTTAVLAAIATGVAMGVPLAVAAKAVAAVEPFEGRMQPVILDDGITFIRDDFKASSWTLDSVFDFMRQARSARKIIVIGTISDAPGDAGRKYVHAARAALAIADNVVFIGKHAAFALKAKRDVSDPLHVFAEPRAAADHLGAYLRGGDLVLLKGSIPADHLQRQILVRTTGVECWRKSCGRRHFCDTCDALLVPSNERDHLASGGEATILPIRRAVTAEDEPQLVFVVGLGNPGAEFVDTPHNVGQRTADLLAKRLGQTWEPTGARFLALRTRVGRVPICLLKPLVPMNYTGRELLTVADELGFGIAQCVVLQDDIDLPLGVVRTRMRGSDGGHRGIQSIIEAFQDDKFRRIKIGVGGPLGGQLTRRNLLVRFPPDELAIVDEACAKTVDKLAHLLTIGSRAHEKANVER